MGNFPGDFNFGYVAKIENLTLSSFSLPIFIDKIFSRVSYRNWVQARNMNMSSHSKIMIIKNILNSSAYNL